jgi:CBS domain-containing protein
VTRQLKAQDIMSTPVVVVRENDAIPDVVRAMRRHGISGVPVLNTFGLLAGIITEADILSKEAGPGGLSALDYLARVTHRVPDAWAKQAGRTAREVMTPNVTTATEDTSVHELARLMVRGGVNRVPIMRGEDMVGIVTRADVIAMFDRAPAEILADTRQTLSERLRLDPNAFEIVVVNGVVQIRGAVANESDFSLIETFVGEVDGVSGVDVSHLHVDRSLSA